jgi:hypothetical protein
MGELKKYFKNYSDFIYGVIQTFPFKKISGSRELARRTPSRHRFRAQQQMIRQISLSSVHEWHGKLLNSCMKTLAQPTKQEVSHPVNSSDLIT